MDLDTPEQIHSTSCTPLKSCFNLIDISSAQSISEVDNESKFPGFAASRVADSGPTDNTSTQTPSAACDSKPGQNNQGEKGLRPQANDFISFSKLPSTVSKSADMSTTTPSSSMVIPTNGAGAFRPLWRKPGGGYPGWPVYSAMQVHFANTYPIPGGIRVEGGFITQTPMGMAQMDTTRIGNQPMFRYNQEMWQQRPTVASIHPSAATQSQNIAPTNGRTDVINSTNSLDKPTPSGVVAGKQPKKGLAQSMWAL